MAWDLPLLFCFCAAAAAASTAARAQDGTAGLIPVELGDTTAAEDEAGLEARGSPWDVWNTSTPRRHAYWTGAGNNTNSSRIATPAPCVVGQWSSWSQCSKTCGVGSMTRVRRHFAGGAGGQRPCKVPEKQIQPCNKKGCPADCKMTEWTRWGHCSKTCGYGRQARARSIITPATFGGKACGDRKQSRPCTLPSVAKECPPGT